MLVRKVEDELLQRLQTGMYAPGEKLPSIREMCSEFGCSYVIAFRAVQTLKASGYLETFKGSGTFVARDIAARLQKKQIAYIFDNGCGVQLNLHDSLRYTCFQKLVRKAGFVDLALQEDEELPDEELDKLAGALITLRTPLMDRLIERHIPCVFISSLGNAYGMPSVTPDFYHGSSEVMHHLLACGYRRILAVTIDAQAFNQASFEPRMSAYQDAMNEAGLVPQAPFEWNICKPEVLEKFHSLMKQENHPDTIFAASDKLAVEVIQELEDAGFRVPGDIGVAGLENMEYLYGRTAPLTTASFDNRKLVKASCALLLKMISHPGAVHKPQKLPMDLIIRNSTLNKANTKKEAANVKSLQMQG